MSTCTGMSTPPETHSPTALEKMSHSRKGRKLASGVHRRPSGLAPAGVVFRNNTSYHFPAAAGRRPSESRDGRPPISMARGGGSRPRVAPRIPPRAPRTTRADTWRAFPPKTSGPAARPGRGLAPRRPGGRDRLFLCERPRFAPSNQPGLLTRPMRVQTHLDRACIVRCSRTAGGPSRFETQGCAADGTADSPELWRAATSTIML
jgi:hypothetical protein